MPETAMIPEEAGTQSAAHEFYGDSQKNLLNGKNSYRLYSIKAKPFSTYTRIS
jgi:hypothetical protein